MVNKINEIIESINSGLDPEEVLRIVRTELENYYTKEEVDDLIASIDFSPYYTKTEVNAIISRVDGDVDAVEGRLDTAEGDIDALETNKQDTLVSSSQIEIDNNQLKLKGWVPIPVNEWRNYCENPSATYKRATEDLIVYVHQPSYGGGPMYAFIPKGALSTFIGINYTEGRNVNAIYFIARNYMKIDDLFDTAKTIVVHREGWSLEAPYVSSGQYEYFEFKGVTGPASVTLNKLDDVPTTAKNGVALFKRGDVSE